METQRCPKPTATLCRSVRKVFIVKVAKKPASINSHLKLLALCLLVSRPSRDR